jgi:glucose dehydrogenase
MYQALRFALLIAAASAASQLLAAPVDDPRMLAADDERGNWLLHGRTYANHRYSPLAQVNRDNVKRLVPRWIYQTGTAATFQATPLVIDGVMYLSMPFNHVAAIDARSGIEIWRYEHKRKTQKMCCGPANRGVAVAYGKVFIATIDARLIALEQQTGKLAWDIDLVDERDGAEESAAQLDPNLRGARVSGTTGVGAVMAPIAYGGKVFAGITGVGYGLHLDSPRSDAPIGAVVGVSGRYGRPGFLAAFDAATGRRVWQFDTVPSQGWEGPMAEATADGLRTNRDLAAERARLAEYPDAWRYGGGSAWSTPVIDPDLGLLYFGTGNPSPQMDDESRPGDNLYTVSLVALHLDSGKLAWYYQQVPHDLWGYDVAGAPFLFDLTRGYDSTPAIGQASKTGWMYVHDRRDGRLLYRSEAFVPQENMFARATAEGVRVAPGGAGGANWSPVAFDPASGLAYVAALHMPLRYTLHQKPSKDGQAPLRYTSLEPSQEPTWGTLTAIDTRDRGSLRWQQKTNQPLIGGVLASAGGLVFTGEGDGNFSAFDSASGERLWQFQCGAGVNAPPISYELDGRQYIAVAAGGSALFGYRQGGAVIVFALMD